MMSASQQGLSSFVLRVMMLGGHENNTMYPPEGGCFSVLLLLQVIKVYNEDNTSRAIEVPNDISARDICQLFVLKNNCIDDHSWTLFEHLSLLGIGKTRRQKGPFLRLH